MFFLCFAQDFNAPDNGTLQDRITDDLADGDVTANG